MKYLNPNTRKRPEFRDMCEKLMNEGKRLTGMSCYVWCQCGIALTTQEAMFSHWQEGHFDVYEEYKEKI